MITPKIIANISLLVTKIESGKFTTNDVISFLTQLRDFSGKNTIFRELGDFVAHNSSRNEGLVCDSITRVAESMKYFFLFNMPGKSLDISKTMPEFVLRHFRAQINLADDEQLLKNFGFDRKKFLKHLDTFSEVNRKEKTFTLKLNKVGKNFIPALNMCLSSLVFKPAFNLDEFFAQLLEVLHKCSIPFDRERLQNQYDKIALALLCVMDATRVDLPDGGTATCAISTESNYRIISGKRRNKVDAITTHPKQFGHLGITGTCTLLAGGPTISFTIVETTLDPHVYCSKRQFSEYIEWNEFGILLKQYLDLDKQMQLNKNFKLVPLFATKHLRFGYLTPIIFLVRLLTRSLVFVLEATRRH